MRCLLHYVKRAQSYEDLRTFEGKLFPTFREAAIARHLLDDDREWQKCLYEASQIKTGSQLRYLFASIIGFGAPVDPFELWSEFKDTLCEDLLYRARIGQPLTEMCESIWMRALHLISEYCKPLGISLERCPGFKILDWSLGESNNIDDSVNIEMCRNSFERTMPLLLNQDQLNGLNDIILAVNSNIQRTFFIDGPGGSGKTFLYSALLDYFVAASIPCIPVASSGVASLLLKNGRTAHSTFKIPIPCDEFSICSIQCQSALADILIQPRVIIWEEIPGGESISNLNIWSFLAWHMYGR